LRLEFVGKQFFQLLCLMIATAEAPNTARAPMGARPQLAFFDMSALERKPTRIDKIVLVRKNNTLARNERIRERFNSLYNTERKRIDDVITILCEEFSLAKSTIESALKS
jgi:hypothetical protein